MTKPSVLMSAPSNVIVISNSLLVQHGGDRENKAHESRTCYPDSRLERNRDVPHKEGETVSEGKKRGRGDHIGVPIWTIKIYLKSSRCIMVNTTERHGEAPLKDDLFSGCAGGFFPFLAASREKKKQKDSDQPPCFVSQHFSVP